MSDCKGWTDQGRNASAGRFILLMVLVLACGRGWAQTTGSSLGLITDQNGAVVPSATVRVTDTDTGFTKNTVSTAEGTYLVPLLPVGHYSVAVEASGFRSFTRTDVLVPVAQNIRVDVHLQVGGVDQMITVEGNAVNIETTNATLGQTIDTARLNSLPLNGRNALGLLQTLPGVAVSNTPTYVTWARSGPSFSISGSRTDFGNLMLDGTTFTDAISNTSQNLPTVDALQEFRVLTGSYGAEYGRASGRQRHSCGDQIGNESIPRQSLGVPAQRRFRRGQRTHSSRHKKAYATPKPVRW